MPTCGAASPTPWVAYMTRNISLAIFFISPDFSSSSVTSAFSARSDGWGYFRTRRSVPSTSPGSTSSVADWMAVVLVLAVVPVLIGELYMVEIDDRSAKLFEKATDLLMEDINPSRDIALQIFMEWN